MVQPQPDPGGQKPPPDPGKHEPQPGPSGYQPQPGPSGQQPQPGPSGQQQQPPPHPQQNQQRSRLNCLICNREFYSVGNKNKHDRNVHRRQEIERWLCHICNRVFATERERLVHFDEDHQVSTSYFRTVSALSNNVMVHTRNFFQDIQREQRHQPFQLLCSSEHTNEVKSIINDHLKTCHSFKAALIVTCLFKRDQMEDENDNTDDDALPTLYPLRSGQKQIFRRTDLDEVVHEMLEDVNQRLDDMHLNQSGWFVVRVLFSQLEVNTCAKLNVGHSGGLIIDHIPNHSNLINLRNIPGQTLVSLLGYSTLRDK